MAEPTRHAEYVAAVVAEWQRMCDACKIVLWQKNRPDATGRWGEGPVNLTYLAQDAVRVVLAQIGGEACDG